MSIQELEPLTQQGYWSSLNFAELPESYQTSGPPQARAVAARFFVRATNIARQPIEVDHNSQSYLLPDFEGAYALQADEHTVDTLGVLETLEKKVIVKKQTEGFNILAVLDPVIVWQVGFIHKESKTTEPIWASTFARAFLPKFLEASAKQEQVKMRSSVHVKTGPLLLGKSGYIHPSGEKLVLTHRTILGAYAIRSK